MTEILLTTLLTLGGGVITYLVNRVRVLEVRLQQQDLLIDDLFEILYKTNMSIEPDNEENRKLKIENLSLLTELKERRRKLYNN